MSTLRRAILADPSTFLVHSRPERVALWCYRIDWLICASGGNVCALRVRWWRGDVVAVALVAGSAKAIPPALVARETELRAIKLVAARAGHV